MKANNVRGEEYRGISDRKLGPFMREVESRVVSGIASAVAFCYFSATLELTCLLWGISCSRRDYRYYYSQLYWGALIDDKFIDRLNNEIIRPVY